MPRRPARLIALAAFAALASATFAQTSQPATTAPADGVPVTHVSLFSSGVGYFQHAGTVHGDAMTDLGFKADQINDVLKSLVLQDLDGGSVSTVNYPSQDPLGHALKGFEIDLSEAPAISQLLGQLRGAEVLVTTSGNRLTGKILGVETRKKPVKDTTIDSATLNLITDAGIQSIAIDDASSIQLINPKLQDELSKALAAVASARDADKKTVTVHFSGTGDRHVQIGYVIPTPIWKTSYRLDVGDKPDDKSNLQGWAIVENQTDGDWNHINLSLISGRPLSFQMDLYQPLYVERPTVALDLFQGLVPPRYAEARDEFQAGRATRASNMASQVRGYGMGGGVLAPAPASAAVPQGQLAGEFGDMPAMKTSSMDFFSSIANRATAAQIGELFEYQLSNITLARQSSAMVPIVNDGIEVTPVSIFNQGVLARYPLTGARVKNTTGKNLLQGPITVFRAGSYAGDAQINNVPPNQTRLISYGIDLQVLVDADKTDNTVTTQTIKIVDGIVAITNKSVSARHYRMENKSDRAKTIVIEHPKVVGSDLVDTDKPAETTDAFYRFERKLDPGKQDELIVKQQTISSQGFGLIDTDPNQLLSYASDAAADDAVKAALHKAVDLRQQQADLDRQIAEATAQIQQITEEQNRMRENMRTIEHNSNLYGRLMTKLDAQETTIDNTRTSIADLTKQRDAKRTELTAYLKDLKVN